MNKQSLKPLSLKKINIDDKFWNRYTKLISDSVIPYQWNILNDAVSDAPPSHCLKNFKIAAGLEDGERCGTVFLDSDLYKWLEAVSYSLAINPDSELEERADDVIDLIGKAQSKDGYLNTYYTLVENNKRWFNLVEGHELYCAGHFIEAAVAYFQVTGKDKLLNMACRFADLISETFGYGEDKNKGYPGHPEIELALIRLYSVTNEKKYLELAKYFVDIRGQGENYFLKEMNRPDYKNLYPEFLNYSPAYSQSHVPVREQTAMEGHAVRAMYLYCAVADLGNYYKDDALLSLTERLWDNMVNRRMYITGSIGSSGLLERFTTDYDLPNDSNYSETCASIGLAQLGLRLAKYTRKASYIDIVERALYNTVRAGISLEGNRYFYVNPLEVWPEVCMPRTSREHVKPIRQKWFDVACCPTNIARTFTALGQYMYFKNDRELFINLFINNTTTMEIGEKEIGLSLETDYPKTGNINIKIEGKASFALMLRVPFFAKNYKVKVNNAEFQGDNINGYFKLEKEFDNDLIQISFDIESKFAYANPLTRMNCGKIALVRGPEIYCFEEVDNGKVLSSIYIDPKTELKEIWEENLFGGTMRIVCQGKKQVLTETDASYAFDVTPKMENIDLVAIPYGSWGNRIEGEMIVWVHHLNL